MLKHYFSKDFLKTFAKTYFIDAMTGMALGLFVTLIAGLILKQIGTWLDLGFLISIGKLSIALMGAGIGAGIAWYLKAPPLVLLSTLIAGLMGAHADLFISENVLTLDQLPLSPGNPVSAYISSVFAYKMGSLVAGKTKLDILLIPITVLLTAYLATLVLAPPVISLVTMVGQGIEAATALQPFLMGIIISVVVGILLTLPTSSAAICIAIGLDGIAGGAAVVGCAAHMVGFAVASFRENGIPGCIAQGLGTSMLQIPNLFRKPVLFVPVVVASAVVGPLASTVFHLKCAATGSGMGTAGFVGIFSVLEASKDLDPGTLALAIVLLMFVLPAVIAGAVSEWMRKKGIIEPGDLKLPS